MIRVYVEYTNDTSIIAKALPTLVKEHQFFMNNRTVDVEVDGETYTLNHYQVSNTQPRPESYYEDYTTANNNSYYAEGGIIYPGIPLGKIFNHDLQTKCINYLFIVRSLDKTPRSNFDVETIAPILKLFCASTIDSERSHPFLY
jgi:neutral trehalase